MDGSKQGQKTAAAAVRAPSYKKSSTLRLQNTASIFSADLEALRLALKQIEDSVEDRFVVLSDSLSSLKANHINEN